MDALMDAGHAAGRELDLIEQELGAGDLRSVASRLALLLRLDPALAPVIISTADRALASPSLDASGHAALNLVKGDAYRGLCREVEATAAYQQAQRALPAHRSTEEDS
jgi:predicted negative regulator of RcsB-dependent stress response